MSKGKLFYIFVLSGLISGSVLSYSQSDTSKYIKFKKKVSISLGMGISYGTAPSFRSYLLEVLPLSKDSVRTFNVGIEFFGGLEYELSKKFSIRLEYAYFIRSI